MGIIGFTQRAPGVIEGGCVIVCVCERKREGREEEREGKRNQTVMDAQRLWRFSVIRLLRAETELYRSTLPSSVYMQNYRKEDRIDPAGLYFLLINNNNRL